MNQNQRNALFREPHKSIEEAATAAVSDLVFDEPGFTYPANAGFTPAEQLAVKEVQIPPELQSALRKVIASAAAQPLHDELLKSYWQWRDVRPEKRWKLDTYEG